MLSPKVIVYLALVAARINASNGPHGVYDPLWNAAYDAEKGLTAEELAEARTIQKLCDHVSYFGWICKWVAPYPHIFA
jgi:SH3-like domain-containing protein